MTMCLHNVEMKKTKKGEKKYRSLITGEVEGATKWEGEKSSLTPAKR